MPTSQKTAIHEDGREIEIPADVLARAIELPSGRGYYKIRVRGKRVLQWMTGHPCDRCGGKGGWEGWPGFTCFRCGGTGSDPSEYRLLTDEDEARLRAAQEKRDIAARKQADATFAANVAKAPCIPDIVTALAAQHDAYENDMRVALRIPTFVEDIVYKARTWDLSDKQVDSLIKAWEKHLATLAERQAEVEMAEPCPTGKALTLTGTILKTEWRDSQYGGQWKMVVKEDRGFRVWSSLPTSLSGAETGTRVQFVADVEQSEDDEQFGFCKRPRKGEVLS